MSERVLRAMAPFGGPRTEPRSRVVPSEILDRVLGSMAPGVVLVTGPSGAGKTSLVRAVIERLGKRGGACVCADSIRVPRERPVATLMGRLPIDEWLGVLSRAGLAEARLFATRAGDLSEGETARLRLALAMARVERAGFAPALVCDEFCSTLDRDTAAGVASSLRRWATARGARVAVATGHADMVRLLGPDRIVRIGPCGRVSVGAGTGRARGPRVRIERGDLADYRALAPLHYRPGRPASVCRVLRATTRGAEGPRLAGVLVVSYPTLNGAWREVAWPGRYVAPLGERARAARRVNRELRRISRVIIDPRDRGRGIATRLVRAYLEDPLTPATEAVSAMGRLSPFTRSAGMTEYALPPRPADDRLADMLDAMGLEPWQLMDADRVAGLGASRDGAWLARELRVWAGAVRSSVPKPARDAPDPLAYAPLAAARLCAPPRAAVAVR